MVLGGVERGVDVSFKYKLLSIPLALEERGSHPKVPSIFLFQFLESKSAQQPKSSPSFPAQSSPVKPLRASQ